MKTTKTDWELIKKIEAMLDGEAFCCVDDETDEENEVETNIEALQRLVDVHMTLLGGDAYSREDLESGCIVGDFYHQQYRMEHGYTGFHDWENLFNELYKIETVKELYDFVKEFNDKEVVNTYTVDDYIKDESGEYSWWTEEDFAELKKEVNN